MIRSQAVSHAVPHCRIQTEARMTNNDMLSIRTCWTQPISRLSRSRGSIPELKLDKENVKSFLAKEDSGNNVECSDMIAAHFLDGLIIDRRGRNENMPQRKVDARVTNNLVLKKLRVAFELRDEDMHAIFSSAEFPVTKPELSALFRQPGHKHYRDCGDQMLRNFLKGLTMRLRDMPANP